MNGRAYMVVFKLTLGKKYNRGMGEGYWVFFTVIVCRKWGGVEGYMVIFTVTFGRKCKKGFNNVEGG